MIKTQSFTWFNTLFNIQHGGRGYHSYQKNLELVGVGYRAQLQGNKLVLQVGYSHPVEFEPGKDMTIEVPAQNKIIVKGIDKEQVGALAANIRAVRA